MLQYQNRMTYQIEQEFTLKDGRKIFKTHNGFKYWLLGKNKEKQEVSEEYWKKAFKNRI